LYCPKLALEDEQILAGNVQVKKTLETSAGPELRDWLFSYIDYALYGILPNDPKEAAVIRRKAPKFYYNAITRTLYHRSHDGILLVACHIKRHRKHSKRLMTLCAELTNLAQSSKTDSEDLDIIGQR